MATGINGKMSELNAALGLLQLQHIDQAIERRAAIDALYRDRLAGLPGLRMLPPPAGATRNHSYFPVLVGPDFPVTRDALYQRLRDAGIMARRYFYPLISDFPMYRGLPSARPEGLPVARQAASEVLCLPIYPSLAEDDLQRVVDVILQAAADGRRTPRGPAANAAAQPVALAA